MSAVAVAYLARGADENSDLSFARFRESYARHEGGVPHDLVIILKGFSSRLHMASAKDAFAGLDARFIEMPDEGFDIAAYIRAAGLLPHRRMMFMNTHSEILCGDWLIKLAANLDRRDVGLVGSTASYESLAHYDPRFPVFPNAHLRSNAFMIDRKRFLSLTGDIRIGNKDDAFMFESGPNSLTMKVKQLGLSVVLVGRNGRGYAEAFWPDSETFRLGSQENLLVGDNQTRDFHAFTYPFKHATSQRTWGPYLDRLSQMSRYRAGPARARR